LQGLSPHASEVEPVKLGISALPHERHDPSEQSRSAQLVTTWVGSATDRQDPESDGFFTLPVPASPASLAPASRDGGGTQTPSIHVLLPLQPVAGHGAKHAPGIAWVVLHAASNAAEPSDTQTPPLTKPHDALSAHDRVQMPHRHFAEPVQLESLLHATSQFVSPPTLSSTALWQPT
jgi:hypothetical protein